MTPASPSSATRRSSAPRAPRRRSAARSRSRRVARLAGLDPRLDAGPRAGRLGEDLRPRRTARCPRFCLGLNLEPERTEPTGAERRPDRAHRGRARPARPARDPLPPRRRHRGARARRRARLRRGLHLLAKPEHHHPEPPEDAIIVATYPATIEAAFARSGPTSSTSTAGPPPRPRSRSPRRPWSATGSRRAIPATGSRAQAASLARLAAHELDERGGGASGAGRGARPARRAAAPAGRAAAYRPAGPRGG